jgi:hypothetical protein
MFSSRIFINERVLIFNQKTKRKTMPFIKALKIRKYKNSIPVKVWNYLYAGEEDLADRSLYRGK